MPEKIQKQLEFKPAWPPPSCALPSADALARLDERLNAGWRPPVRPLSDGILARAYRAKAAERAAARGQQLA